MRAGPGRAGAVSGLGAAQGERELRALEGRGCAGAEPGFGRGGCLVELVLSFPRVASSGISTSSLRSRRGRRCGRGWRRLLSLPHPWNGGSNRALLRPLMKARPGAVEAPGAEKRSGAHGSPRPARGTEPPGSEP